ncbi:hypothetical protein [Agromyces sp. NPDC058064]|uniref:hypothetical protein n=1 Tax=Agromyces sp. NPDC058064 TaxID=3346322 RepID=UPI0036DF080B
MNSGGGEFEYPDTAGYPDGMGTLHEGVDDDRDAEGDVEDAEDAEDDEAAAATEGDLERFALEDEEDVEGV